MRILIVNQYYPPDASATAYLLGELAEDLARQHDVWVVAGQPSYNPDVNTFRPQGVHLSRVRSTAFTRSGMASRLLNYGTFFVGSLLRAIRLPRPDVVVGFTDPPVIGLVGLLAARRFRAPFVYVCQDIYPDVSIALGRADDPVTVRLLRASTRALRRGAAAVVAIGRDMQEKLEREGVPPERIALIPNWAASGAVEPGSVLRTRRAMGWEGRYVVMHAGNVGLAQNLMTLVDAAGHLRDRPDVSFVILGDGAARAELEGATRRKKLANVTFIPYRPKVEAQVLMAAADLHVISLAPGLRGSVVPSKVYGLLALGMPFVAAVEADTEIDLLLGDLGGGTRVEPGDGAGMAAAIGRFADGGVDGADFGRRARAEYERRYTRPIATARYRTLLERLGAANGRVPQRARPEGRAAG